MFKVWLRISVLEASHVTITPSIKPTVAWKLKYAAKWNWGPNIPFEPLPLRARSTSF